MVGRGSSIDQFFDSNIRPLSYFGLGFELDYAEAILNKSKPGKHHPDNLQLLLKAHNTKKNHKNWKRCSIDEQLGYIKTAVEHQGLIASRLDIVMEGGVLDALLIRLKNIY